MDQLSLSNNRLEFKTAGNITKHLEDFLYYRIYPSLIKESRRMSTCNWLDLQTLGSQLVMSKNLPNHCAMIGENRQLVTNGPAEFEK